MINKQSLWFLTLFSLILVLSVYYITMPNELLLSNNNSYVSTEKTDKTDEVVVQVEESDLLTAMRVSLDSERLSIKEDLESNLTDVNKTAEEKNNIYEQLKLLTDIQGREEKIEAKIKNALKLDSFVKIEDDQVSVVLVTKDHDKALANNIMRLVQEEFTDKMFVSVKFED
jgi:stage III sporulation protein AH